MRLLLGSKAGTRWPQCMLKVTELQLSYHILITLPQPQQTILLSSKSLLICSQTTKRSLRPFGHLGSASVEGSERSLVRVPWLVILIFCQFLRRFLLHSLINSKLCLPYVYQSAIFRDDLPKIKPYDCGMGPSEWFGGATLMVEGLEAAQGLAPRSTL